MCYSAPLDVFTSLPWDLKATVQHTHEDRQYIPGMSHVRPSPRSSTLFGQAQIRFGDDAFTWGVGRHRCEQPPLSSPHADGAEGCLKGWYTWISMGE